ncbi:MAG: 4-hydroxy-tetrahydrodipicolinate reductase [Endomicrobium sp.]|jgi:4-hydroxy-tetrahydrodipicolinate reductase|nr:4-hydroxy-tetrahydrodipicolinate reductase [Endomicrobium sp.]
MKVTICGAMGKMGRAIMEASEVDKDIEIFGALDNKSKNNNCISSIKYLEKFLVKTNVLIDFTNPESSVANVEMTKKYSVPTVIGTTGFTSEQKQYIINASKDIPIVISPNMSSGINVLLKIVEYVAKKLPDYDKEIVELHHNKKKDSPSGTAIKLAEMISKDQDLNNIAIYGRHSTNLERRKNEIGIFSVRAGDIIGDHTVYFVGTGERLELTHRAQSRQAFAMGAIKAAKWIINKNPGLYSMIDVLNI